MNNGRLLPWHDTPRCHAKDPDGTVCGLSMVPVRFMANGYGGSQSEAHSRIACTGCGEARRGTDADVAQAERSQAAWAAHERGEVWPDRGCAECNAPLPLDRFRLCLSCVEKDNAKRQGSLFP